MANLFGTNPNQVPLNSMLGNLAFQDKAYVSVDKVGIGSTFVDSGTSGQILQVYGGGAYISGSVGIGSTNPTTKLDVQGGNGFIKIGEVYTGLNGITLNSSTSIANYNFLSSASDYTLYINRPINAPIRFRMNNSDQMVLEPSGNLGINSSSPTSRLDVVGDAKILGVSTFTAANTPAVVIRSGASGSYTALDIGRTGGEFSIGMAAGGGQFATDAVAGDVVIRSNVGKLLFNYLGGNASLAVAGSNVLVGTVSSTGTASQALQVNSGAYVSGNLGIGVTNPSSRLTVYGTNSDTTPILSLLSGNQQIGFNNGAQIAFGYDGTNTYQHFIQTRHNAGNSNNAIDFYVSDGTQNNTLTSGSVHTMSLVSGNVGINSTSPTSRLDVVGNARVSGVVTASQFSTGSGTIGFTTNTISGPAEIVIDPSAVGDNTGSVRIKGDLYVDGTQFIVNSSTIELADFNVGIATTVGTNALLDGAGIGIGSTTIRKTITWNNGLSALSSSENWNIFAGKTYKIGGTDVLTSNTLGSGVVNSSLTSVGTLGQLNVSGITTSSRLTLNGANNTADGGGQIYLNGATGNRIDFNNNGVAAPSFTTRSAGTKIVLNSAVSGSTVDYGFGIETATLWYSVASSAQQHRWYAATTQLADLKGTGELVIGSTSLTGTASQRLQVTGGAYVSGNLGVGNTSPSSRLDVLGDSNLRGMVILPQNPNGVGFGTTISSPSFAIRQGMGDSDSWQIYGESPNGANTGRLVFEVNDDIDDSERFLFRTRRTYTSIGGTSLLELGQSGNIIQYVPLFIGAATSTGTASQRLQVTGGGYVSGNLGVGDTNPLAKLSVATNGKSISDGNVPVQVSTQSAGGLAYYGANNNGSYGALFGYDGSWGGGAVRVVGASDVLTFVVNNTTRAATITPAGNFGIGTTNPSDKLHVLGNTIRVDSATGALNFWNGSGWYGGIGVAGGLGGSGTDIAIRAEPTRGIIFFTGGANDRGRINADGVFLVGTATSTGTASQRLQVTGGGYVSGDVGIGTTNPSYKLHVVGSFGATTKSFVIDHPTKEGKKLQYGSLEGPELGVYVRGRTQSSIIELPDYWTGLVDETSITVNLTPIGRKSPLHSVVEISNNTIEIESANDVIDCFYTVFAERKDVEKLEVEF